MGISASFGLSNKKGPVSSPAPPPEFLLKATPTFTPARAPAPKSVEEDDDGVSAGAGAYADADAGAGAGAGDGAKKATFDIVYTKVTPTVLNGPHLQGKLTLEETPEGVFVRCTIETFSAEGERDDVLVFDIDKSEFKTFTLPAIMSYPAESCMKTGDHYETNMVRFPFATLDNFARPIAHETITKLTKSVKACVNNTLFHPTVVFTVSGTSLLEKEMFDLEFCLQLKQEKTDTQLSTALRMFAIEKYDTTWKARMQQRCVEYVTAFLAGTLSPFGPRTSDLVISRPKENTVPRCLHPVYFIGFNEMGTVLAEIRKPECDLTSIRKLLRVVFVEVDESAVYGYVSGGSVINRIYLNLPVKPFPGENVGFYAVGKEYVTSVDGSRHVIAERYKVLTEKMTMELRPKICGCCNITFPVCFLKLHDDFSSASHLLGLSELFEWFKCKYECECSDTSCPTPSDTAAYKHRSAWTPDYFGSHK